MRKTLTQKEKNIEKYLLDCGFRADLGGFQILRECIYTASKDRQMYRANIHATLLKEVKDKFHFDTTGQCTAALRHLSRNCSNLKYKNLSAKKLIFTILAEMGC